MFFHSMHRQESSSLRSTTWWSGVIVSTFAYSGCKTDTLQILWFYLASLACAMTWPRNTNRKVKHKSYSGYDDHLMLAFEAAPPHVMIGCGVVNLVCVITKTTRGMLFLSGSSRGNFWINLNLIYHEHSLNCICIVVEMASVSLPMH